MTNSPAYPARSCFYAAFGLWGLCLFGTPQPSLAREKPDSGPDTLWVDRPLLRVEVIGLRSTRPEVVWRELSAREGRRLVWSRLERERLRLLDLDLFAEISVSAKRDATTNRPVLTIEVKERPTLLAYPVLDYDPQDGLLYGGHLSTINLFGRSQRLGLSFLGGGRRGVSAGFYSPWLSGRRLGVGFQGFAERSRNRTEKLRQVRKGGLFLLVPTAGPRAGFPLEAGAEEVRTRPEDAGKRAKGQGEPDTREDHRWMQVGAWLDTRDYRTRPTAGSVLSVSAAQHGGLLGGETAFQRYRLDLLRVFATGRQTALTAASRLVWSRGAVPRYLRVNLGGVETLRGLGQGALGGESRWNGWVEERFPLLPKRTFSVWRGRYVIDLTLDWAAFVDGGAVWERRALERGKARAQWGAGLGLRLVAPLFHLLSFDVATDGRSVRVYGVGGSRL
jgi:outer membrane protein assembly factor BamA